MPTSYPGGLDAFTNPTAGDMLDNPPHDVQHANANDAVEAIEAELGTAPSGGFTTVKARIEDVEARLPAWVTYLARPSGTPHAADDEFNDGVLDPAWTLVQPASPVITAAESLDVLSITHPGGGANVTWNLMKPFAPAGDFTLETAVRMTGSRQNYQVLGVVAADGAVYGAGSQATASLVVPSTDLPIIDLRSQTNYTTGGTITQENISFVAAPMFLRLRRVGGTWTAFYSADAVSWRSWGAISFPVTVSHVGVFVTPSAGAGPLHAAFDYLRVTEP